MKDEQIIKPVTQFDMIKTFNVRQMAKYLEYMNNSERKFTYDILLEVLQTEYKGDDGYER